MAAEEKMSGGGELGWKRWRRRRARLAEVATAASSGTASGGKAGTGVETWRWRRIGEGESDYSREAGAGVFFSFFRTGRGGWDSGFERQGVRIGLGCMRPGWTSGLNFRPIIFCLLFFISGHIKPS